MLYDGRWQWNPPFLCTRSCGNPGCLEKKGTPFWQNIIQGETPGRVKKLNDRWPESEKTSCSIFFARTCIYMRTCKKSASKIAHVGLKNWEGSEREAKWKGVRKGHSNGRNPLFLKEDLGEPTPAQHSETTLSKAYCSCKINLNVTILISPSFEDGSWWIPISCSALVPGHPRTPQWVGHLPVLHPGYLLSAPGESTGSIWIIFLDHDIRTGW